MFHPRFVVVVVVVADVCVLTVAESTCCVVLESEARVFHALRLHLDSGQVTSLPSRITRSHWLLGLAVDVLLEFAVVLLLD